MLIYEAGKMKHKYRMNCLRQHRKSVKAWQQKHVKDSIMAILNIKQAVEKDLEVNTECILI